MNYLIIVVAVTAVCMVLSPSSLAVLAVLALLWIYIFIVRKDPLVLGGRTFRYGHPLSLSTCDKPFVKRVTDGNDRSHILSRDALSLARCTVCLLCGYT